jgi:filamentous hemagglutinin family protein
MTTSPTTVPVRRATLLALFAGSLLGLHDAQAGPQGEKVVRGSASFSRNGGVTTITAAHNTIINYKSFNIGSAEAVRFVQPGATSRVLNRINSAAPTRIDGALTANGRVFIVNPSGVIFGRGAIVDAAGLYAGAARISDQDFLRGVLHFTNVSGAVVNEGMIDAQSVMLVGSRIQNHGTIVADGGMVTTMVGRDVMVREGDGQIYAKINGRAVSPAGRPSMSRASARPGPAAIQNTGTISARGGLVSLGAGDGLSLAIHNLGTIEAAGGSVSAVSNSGSIVNHGTISASVPSGQAGSVTVKAPSVVNAGTISADAGAGAAGSVTFTSSRSTILTEGSVTSAAGGSGVAKGGELLVHSYMGSTLVEEGALVDLSGGAAGGDGGAGEVSGSRLGIYGEIKGDTAAGYESASVLFDPLDIVIRSGGGNDGEVGDGAVAGGDSPGDTFEISGAAIEGFSGDVSLEATRNITVFESINKSNGGLTLLAGQDILLSGLSIGNGVPTFPDVSITANFLDLRAGRSIVDRNPMGTQLTSTVGDINTVGTMGAVRFGLATVPSGRTLSITQAQSKFIGAGPFGIVGNPETTNLVVNITGGYLILGGEFGGVSGYQNIGSVDAHASEYLRVEDNLDIGTTAPVACFS